MQNTLSEISPGQDSHQIDEHQKFVIEMVKKFENSTKEELFTVMEELQKICLEFDPYQPQKISQELKASLKKYRLDEMTENPFTFTNNLLRILTSVETEYKLRS